MSDTAPSSADISPSDNEAWFGFRKVAATDKAPLVQGVFDSVARRYDLMNDLMSGGVHRLWKAALIDWLAPRAGQHVLDVAGGTGDIALRILNRAPDARVTLADLTEAMVRVGRDRSLDAGQFGRIAFSVGNAETLAFPDRTFDAYTIAFGLRNVTRIDAALAEARRVLKPGGRFFCLEFSRVVIPGLADLYDRYSFSVLPWLGEKVARDRESYQYLVESIRRFPPQDELVERMGAAGLERCSYRNMSGGIAAIHCGWRL